MTTTFVTFDRFAEKTQFSYDHEEASVAFHAARNKFCQSLAPSNTSSPNTLILKLVILKLILQKVTTLY